MTSRPFGRVYLSTFSSGIWGARSAPLVGAGTPATNAADVATTNEKMPRFIRCSLREREETVRFGLSSNHFRAGSSRAAPQAAGRPMSATVTSERAHDSDEITFLRGRHRHGLL